MRLLPSSAALCAAFFWAAPADATNIFNPGSGSSNTGSSGFAMRQYFIPSAASQGSITVTFGVGSGGGSFVAAKVGICTAAASPSHACTGTTTPTEITCSGGHGFSISGVNATVTCGPVAYSYSGTNPQLVCIDITTDSINLVTGLGSNVIQYYDGGTTSCSSNDMVGGGVGNVSGNDVGVVSVVTTGAGGPPMLTLTGAGQ